MDSGKWSSIMILGDEIKIKPFFVYILNKILKK